MNQTRQLVDLAIQQVTAVTALIGEMRPPVASPGRLQCALFLSISEQHEATTLLTQAGLTTHAAIPLRSMLEALADLRLLGAGPSHVERMRYKQKHGEKKLYASILDAEELPAHSGEMFDARLAECMVQYDPLHEKFGKRGNRRSQADDFIAAGLTDLIATYSMLCSFAHTDLAALAYRHQGEHGMTYRAPVPYDVTFMMLSVASYVLLTAAQTLEKIVYLPEGRFAHHFAILDRLQAQMMHLRPMLAGNFDVPEQECRPEAAQ
jgi:hypothetical protein